MVPALHSEESMGQLRSKSGTGKHFVYIPGNGAKRQLISVRVDVHYQGTGVYRSPERVFVILGHLAGSALIRFAPRKNTMHGMVT